ncbi:hypothetical protein Acife_0528 [Acidithiobacillus ferrivorans SS3]|uniref:Uncharacterized protein n=1 Tax=Acidithiobacillus ferrivorans SS3 TaxID=743299 RepID=G0JTY2_9PROT|nr:hypothetical protein Acife_0528 [Acidithiobacillus ferrivorans SS3]OFA15595.1 hypothetical protein A4U49_11935 [Acidithiobacillus ferrivorans]
MSDSRRTERQTYRLTACQTHFLLFFLTTPDAPVVQFLESVQFPLGTLPKHLRLQISEGLAINGCLHSEFCKAGALIT